MFGLKTYLIKKGKHRSCLKFSPFIRCKEVTMCFRFDESARYLGRTVYESEMINKLGGFGNIFHHRNSIRLGWRYDPINDVILLYIYEYRKGERLEPRLVDKVRIGQTKKFRLKSDKAFWFGRFNFPWWGGKVKAPHDIKIKLSYL